MKKQLLITGALLCAIFANAQTTLIERYRLDYGSSKSDLGTSGDFIGWAVADKDGNQNGAVKFNGQNHLSLGNPAIDVTNGFSISFWYNPSSLMTGSSNYFILSKRASCTVGNQLNIQANPSANTISISIRKDSPSPAFQAFATVNTTADTWQMVTFTVDNANHRVVGYVDGVIKVLNSYTNATGIVSELAPNTDLVLGTSPCVGVDGSKKFIGSVDDISLFEGVLSSTSVTSIFNDGIAAPISPTTKTLSELMIFEDKMNLSCGNSFTSAFFEASSTPNRNADANSAIAFAGVSSGVTSTRASAENPIKELTDNFSSLAISAWIKLDATEPNGFIASNYAGTNACGNSGVQKGVIFRVVANKLNAYISLGSSYYQISTTQTITTNQWHHVAVSLKQPFSGANDLKLYIDGVFAPSTPLSGSVSFANNFFQDPSNQPTSFGGSISTTNTVCNNEYSFKGAIDDIKIFKDTLSSANILTLSQQGTDAFSIAGDVTTDLRIAETFNTFGDSLEFAAKYDAKYDGIKFATDRFGNVKSAILFDAPNAYINVGKNISDITADGDPFAYSVWLNPSDLMSNNMIIGHAGDGGCENQRQQYFRILDGKVNFTAVFGNNAPTSNRIFTGSTILLPGTWYHVVLNVNQPITGDNSVQIYINGVRETLTVTASGTSTGNLPTNTSMLGFGNYLSTAGNPCNTGAGQYPSFKGVLDDIRIYDRALCTEDIQMLYTEESPVITGFSNNFSKANESIVYPNPISGDALQLTKAGSWIVTSSKGVELLSGEGQEINVSTLPLGLYIVQLTTSEGVVSNRFVKQ